MNRNRITIGFGGVLLSATLLASCASSPTATIAPIASAPGMASAAPSSLASAAPSIGASPTVAGNASPTVGTPGMASPTAATPTRAASPATPGGSPTRAASPGAGTPTSGLSPSQAYVRLSGQSGHRQRWAFTGFSVAGLTGNLSPVFDVAGNNRKVTLPNAAGATLEAYQIGGVISVANPIGGGVVTADPGNPLTAPAQALLGLPDGLIFTLAPVNAAYTSQGTQTINGKAAMVYRTQVSLANLGFVAPELQGQSGTATTTIAIDGAQGYLVALESTIQAGNSGTIATARLDVTDVGQVPAIALP